MYRLFTFIVKSTLCILSRFEMIRTIVHTKDSIRGSDIITHCDYSPTSVWTSGEISKHPLVIPYSFFKKKILFIYY